jgi:hypothetical protein
MQHPSHLKSIGVTIAIVHSCLGEQAVLVAEQRLAVHISQMIDELIVRKRSSGLIFGFLVFRLKSRIAWLRTIRWISASLRWFQSVMVTNYSLGRGSVVLDVFGISVFDASSHINGNSYSCRGILFVF